MNLADAIRQAAGGTVQLTTYTNDAKEVHAVAPAPQPAAKREFVEAVRSATTDDSEGLHLETSESDDLTVTSSQNAPVAHPVRFELFLTPEQLSGLFKGVVSAQHSVMTLRETAKYLRIPGRKVEEMAQLGQIPAFLIDGKWRFSRNSVDEWLGNQSFRKEMEA